MGGSLCGDGVREGNEQCDDGKKNGTAGDPCSSTCKSISVLIPEVNLNWSLLHMTGVAGFSGVGCADVGATMARVILNGPSPVDEMLPCSNYGKVYANICPPMSDMGTAHGDAGACTLLQAGKYTAVVQLFDDAGNAITGAVTSQEGDAEPGTMAQLAVDFGMSDFVKQDYTGALYFRPSWGMDGVTCAQATPVVTGERLKLVMDGQTQPVPGMTRGGNPLNGGAGTCYMDTIGDTREEVDSLAWGKYTLSISSLDGYYTGVFPVFVGPGNLGPTFDLTVLGPQPDMTMDATLAASDGALAPDGGLGPGDAAVPIDANRPVD
jgi:cysteine-rich repeat protein